MPRAPRILGNPGIPRTVHAIVLLLTLAIMAGHAASGSRARAAEPTPIQRVVEAGGQRQWVACSGSGSPTVVLISGLGADHRMWSRVFDDLAAEQRTCIVDRPGLGSSPGRVGTRMVDAGTQAEELHAALSAVGETGPLILVAHSYGGLIGRAFARQHRESVAGLLLLEAVWPGIERDFLPSYASPWHEGGTTLDITAGSRAARGSLTNVPVLVIVAGDPQNGASRADARWRARQRAQALAANAPMWEARRSGHVVQRDQPGIVIRGVRHLRQQGTTS